MKSQILKKMMPLTVVVLGISGAFATTAMQSATNSSTAQRTGYLLNNQGACDVEVNCSDTPSDFVCRAAITSGPQAFGKDSSDNCTEILYRP